MTYTVYEQGNPPKKLQTFNTWGEALQYQTMLEKQEEDFEHNLYPVCYRTINHYFTLQNND